MLILGNNMEVGLENGNFWLVLQLGIKALDDPVVPVGIHFLCGHEYAAMFLGKERTVPANAHLQESQIALTWM